MDRAVSESFLSKASNASFVAKHPFSPLLHFQKQTKRYKPELQRTVTKDRPIMYASHRDACILSHYADAISDRLDVIYEAEGLGANVIAYRSPGRSNYELSAEVLRFANAHEPCMVLAFDVSGFFDNLDHALLKSRLKTILKTNTESSQCF